MALRPVRWDGVRTIDPNDDVPDLGGVHGAAKIRPGRHSRDERYNRNPPIDTSGIGRIKIGLD